MKAPHGTKEYWREQKQIWRAANRERHCAISMDWYWRHREEHNARRRARNAEIRAANAGAKAAAKAAKAALFLASREARLQKSRDKARLWREAHKGRTRERDQARYERDGEKIRAYTKAWRDANPDKRRAIDRARRARERGAQGTHTPEDIAAQFKCQRGTCYYCKKKVPNHRGRFGWHVEHVIPLCKGGRNSRDNLVIACWKCNATKNRHGPHLMGILL